jgi:hypothetical protein
MIKMKNLDTIDLGRKTGEIYGRYSFGNIYEHLLSSEGIENLKPILSNDLKMAGLGDRISELEILDVGTGRQALTFSLLGAKRVAHYDISKKHVSRFNKILDSKYPNLKITSTHQDLCANDLMEKEFDFVYLSGIAQHLSNPSIGLFNCAKSVKPGGKIWVYFYRSGTFKWLLCQMIRDLIKLEDIDLYFYCSALLNAKGDLSNMYTSYIMDDFFAPYIHLYPPHNYIQFFNELDFEICGSSHLDPIAKVNHDSAHHSGVLVFERCTDSALKINSVSNIMEPNSSIDQLDENLYESNETKKLILLYKNIKDKLLKNDIPAIRMSFCMSIHKIAAPQYYGGNELPPDWDSLKQILEKTNEYLES